MPAGPRQPANGGTGIGIVAWIVLGLIAGILATALPGAKQSIAVPVAIGITGALLGGWVGARLFHIDTQGFFAGATWITAAIGSVTLLLIYHGIANPARKPLRRGK